MSYWNKLPAVEGLHFCQKYSHLEKELYLFLQHLRHLEAKPIVPMLR
jgi:hypothetical protein